MNLARRMLTWAMAKPPADFPPAEGVALKELRQTFATSPIFPTSGVPASTARWHAYLNRLRDRIVNDDPRKFLQWDVFHEALFVAFAPYVSKEISYLRSRADWPRWRELIKEPWVGTPPRYPLYPASTGNTIHNVCHLAKFEEATGTRISDLDFVLEFGGGYGNLCRLMRSAGFKGRYVIFDFRTIGAVQRYYLKACGVSNVEHVFEIGALDEAIAGFHGKTLFAATWSLSESPVAVRAPLMQRISKFSHFLIAYQARFEEVDNVAFFRDWSASVPVKWYGWNIEEQPGSSYLMGSVT